MTPRTTPRKTTPTATPRTSPRRTTVRTVAAGTALAAVATGATVLAVRRADRPALPPVPPPLAGRVRDLTAADGVRLHVEEHGSADAPGTVVLLHGYTQSGRLWDGQVRDLRAARPDLRVVVVDHRGHGRSDPCQRGTATIEQLGHDLQQVVETVVPTGPVLLAGHSMGGMTMMALAEQRPELFGDRIAAAAFVATSSAGLAEVGYGLPRPLARIVRRALPALNERAARDEAAGRPRQVPMLTVRAIFGQRPRPQDLAVVREDMLGCSAETVAAFLATFSDHDRTAALKALDRVPAVVLHGTLDRLCPLPHGRAIADALEDAELVVYPGAGHMLQLERRHEVSAQLLRLAERSLPRG